jgi:hypothetical protein
LKSEPGPPMTLGNAAAARVRLVVWCKACQYQVEPDAAEQSERYGAEMPVPDWRERLICSKCGSREGCDRDGAAPRVDRAPTPPLVNRSAGVVTPMTPSAGIVVR